MRFSSRRFSRFVLPMALMAATLAPCAAAADEWVEPKFDPPVGSKWVIERELNVEKNAGGTMVGHTLRETALLTIEAKTADGFVVTYTRQGSTYDGDAGSAAEQRIAFQALQGLVVRIDTDLSGKPLRIENYADVKAALKRAIDSEPINTANPEAIAKSRELAQHMIDVDDKRAAELYLDELPTLAMGQSTGVKPDEIRKETRPVANALSDSLTKTVMLSIVDDDPATGKVRYLMTETYDPDAMKALVSQAAREANPTAVNAALVETAIKSAVVSAVVRAQLTVEGGVTRELRKQSVTSFRLPGTISVTSEDELVTVTQAEVPTN